MIPGWPYSLVAALEPGRTSWTRLLDAVRLGPDDDLAAVTAAQVRGVIERIIAAGHWRDGDPDIMVIFDAGYEPARLAWLLRDLPVQVLGRLGTNRVLRQAPPPRRPGQMGPPVRHGGELKLCDDAACPGPDVHTAVIMLISQARSPPARPPPQGPQTSHPPHVGIIRGRHKSQTMCSLRRG